MFWALVFIFSSESTINCACVFVPPYPPWTSPGARSDQNLEAHPAVVTRVSQEAQQGENEARVAASVQSTRMIRTHDKDVRALEGRVDALRAGRGQRKRLRTGR
eukprot:2634784-Pyramimonas_sp.AAC.1